MSYRKTKDLSRSCIVCKSFFDILVVEEDYHMWKGGTLIQVAFPYLTIDDRELLISGICGTCFDKLFTKKE